MFKSSFIRNIEAGNFLEIFLVSAVASILMIRFYLDLTGYPQLGGGGLHIAHMLWGGLLMLSGTILSLSLLNKFIHQLAAFLNGVGFGAFIDELGKFITSDHNYLFRPTISIIYVIFILVYLAFRFIMRHRAFSQQEYIANSLEILQEAVSSGLPTQQKLQALSLLEKCDQQNPHVKALTQLFHQLETTPPQQSRIARIKYFFRDRYIRLGHTRWFPKVVVCIFLFQAFVAVLLIFDLLDKVGRAFFEAQTPVLSFIEWGNLLASIGSGVFVIAGVFYLRRLRIKAYHMFKTSVLVSIFLTQFFTFYTEQFSALLALSFNLMLFLALNYILEAEKDIHYSL